MDHVRTAIGTLTNVTAAAIPSTAPSAAAITAAETTPSSPDFLSELKGGNSRLGSRNLREDVVDAVPNLKTTLKTEANDSEYYESAIFIDDVVLEPLSDFDQSSLVSVLNNTYNYQLEINAFNNINDTVTDTNNFVNDISMNMNLTGTFLDRTVDEIKKSFINESNRRNFDFLTSSLYNYNVADLFPNGTGGSNFNSTEDLWNRSNVITIWEGNGNSTWVENVSPMSGNYWALLLIIFPFLTLFGNVLVILAVVRERTLQTATNYFIVSLALADLLVAVLVMPFAVYVLVNGAWSLPAVVCDFYIAMDVTCSTSSIFNLVAISIDRYIAVTQPIKYAKHKNTQRVWSTIALVWVISAAIGSPIVLGLNNTPDRKPDLCLFYNSDFIIYSSLSSFYIPCIIMVFLYYNIFKALRNRARKAKATRKPNACEILPGSVIENVVQTRRLAETTLGEPARTGGGSSGLEDERPTNTGSGSNEDEGGERSPGSEDIKELGIGVDECEVIPNDKSTEFILSTVVEETSASVIPSCQPVIHDRNGNNDSGYGPSNLDDVQAVHASSPQPKRAYTVPQFKNVSPARERPLDLDPSPRKDQKSSMGSRFTIYKVNKASKKKREKSSAKKERKATKTLAIVLGVFLVCWVPFFTCNILDALCTKLSRSCQPGVAAFILTTWLGYFNSFVNPVIYTIFNPEFRKAFKKIMRVGN